jgi:hypothetical protein
LVSGILAQYVVILHAITVQSPEGWTFIDVHRAEALQVLKCVSKVQLSPTVQQTLNPLMLLTLTIQRHSDQFWQIAILSSFRTVRWRRPDEDSYIKYPCFFAKKFGQGTNYPSFCSFSGFAISVGPSVMVWQLILSNYNANQLIKTCCLLSIYVNCSKCKNEFIYVIHLIMVHDLLCQLLKRHIWLLYRTMRKPQGYHISEQTKILTDPGLITYFERSDSVST